MIDRDKAYYQQLRLQKGRKPETKRERLMRELQEEMTKLDGELARLYKGRTSLREVRDDR